MRVYGMSGNGADRDRVYHTPCANPTEFGSTFMTLGVKSLSLKTVPASRREASCEFWRGLLPAVEACSDFR